MSYDSIYIKCPKRENLKWLPGAGAGAGIITNMHEEIFEVRRVLKLYYGIYCTTL